LPSHLEMKFTLGEPYLPFTQLLSVLPIASNHLLPPCYCDLMTNPQSPIHNMYPLEFDIDMNFTTTPWEGIALLPFIDENILLNILKKAHTNDHFCRFLFLPFNLELNWTMITDV